MDSISKRKSDYPDVGISIKNLKATLINIFKAPPRKYSHNEGTDGEPQQRTETIKKSQMEILELKSTITEMKN